MDHLHRPRLRLPAHPQPGPDHRPLQPRPRRTRAQGGRHHQEQHAGRAHPG
jgi:hypothetical protein